MNLTRLFSVTQSSIVQTQIVYLYLNITIMLLMLARSAAFALVTFSNTLRAIVKIVALHAYDTSSTGKMR